MRETLFDMTNLARLIRRERPTCRVEDERCHGPGHYDITVYDSRTGHRFIVSDPADWHLWKVENPST